jgi:D-xylose reductase
MTILLQTSLYLTCGQDYGNEKEAGQGVKRAIDEGLVKRSDLFITSKLWNTFHEKERVEPITRKQLEWWGLEYFDLFHIHFPVALEYVDIADSYPSGWINLQGKTVQSKASIQETYQALEALYDKGLIKSIGVSNFQGSLLIDVLRYARIRPAVLQIEHHPYLVQPVLLKLAKEAGVAVTSYSTCVFFPWFFETNFVISPPVVLALKLTSNSTGPKKPE